MYKYPKLFEPLKINKFFYKNRIVASPMLFGAAFQRDDSAPMVYRKIEERAKGGAAAVQVGETSINFQDADRMSFRPIDYTKYSGADFEGFKKYAEIIRKYNAVAIIELFHAGQEKNLFPVNLIPEGR